jgi:SAM-dependent methyltransferase
MPAPPTQREYWNSKVGEEWANQADRMDRMLQSMTDAAFDALKLQPGERVLDIGCGAGATTLTAARQVGANGLAVGVDLSRPLLELARKRAAEASGARAEFIEADAGAAPIPGAPFDAAFSRFGVMFFDDPPAAFARLRQTMRRDGRLVFLCWRPFAENLWTFAPLAALAPLLTAPVPPPDPNAPGPFALSDRAKIRSILESSRWRDIEITRWDGDVRIGADAREAARFLLKIGPCARAVADQQLDPAGAERALADFLAKHEGTAGVALAAACWIVRALA